MAQPSTQDILNPFDPTGYAVITGAQLLQYLTGATPYSDKGFVVMTADIAAVPQVPDAVTNPKWQNYLWLRVQAAAVTVYAWNPNAVNDATYLKWTPITAASIPDLSITNNKLGPASVTDDKVASGISYGKLAGIPSSLPPSGVAGGDLTGNYPNPTIAAGAVNGAKIANNVVAPLTHLLVPGGNSLSLLRVNQAATAYEFALQATLQTTMKSVGAANTAVVRAVNNVIPVNTDGAQLVTLNITPVSDTSYLRIRFRGNVSTNAGPKNAAMWINVGAVANAVHSSCVYIDTTDTMREIAMEHIMLSTGKNVAVAIQVRWAIGTAGTIYLNSNSTTTPVLVGGPSWLIVEEIQGTVQ